MLSATCAWDSTEPRRLRRDGGDADDDGGDAGDPARGRAGVRTGDGAVGGAPLGSAAAVCAAVVRSWLERSVTAEPAPMITMVARL